ncbi:MAG: type III-B CRISPR module RAMP protein Cmr1 [Gemmataceae bacterium]|nr:type III-B CRISPR module RAMP protein Cmr1 [Gemmataceae bacterium]MDW8263737.1 type III-B CRISPR module RAMP protein Cmr1 [Gemmataceae bacterium]
MPREIPDLTSPPRPAATGERCYEIHLLTPLFGGGVVTRENDPSFPIRPTSVRGQLQFWWRATVGAGCATIADLREAQSRVWGDTKHASRVRVRVEVLTSQAPAPCAGYERDLKDKQRYHSMPTWKPPFRYTALPYALFPFQGQLGQGRSQIEVPPASCIQKASFRLIIVCDPPIDFDKEVKPALEAWLLLGGLGSRTRRGCGALRCPEFMAKDRDQLITRLRGYLSDRVHEWPTLAASILVGRELKQAIKAWSEAIRVLRDFRQGVSVGRNPGDMPNRPGRSRWPEPETIRRVTGKRSNRHARLTHIPDNAFPRAEIGLPIVFHFKDHGEPDDTVLYPDKGLRGERRERMASPLILRPVALANDRVVPVIVLLNTPRLTGVDLRCGDKSLSLPASTVIEDPLLASYKNSPMHKRSARGSALEAFLAFARGKGFTSV